MARIPLVENPDESLKELYEHYLKTHNKVPEWIKAMAWNPEILLTFHNHFLSVMKHGSLDERLKWHIAHTVSDLNQCKFCISVTEKMLLSLGAEPEKLVLKDINHELSEELFELAKACTLHSYKLDDELFINIKKKLSNKQLVEAIAVIGLFNYINRFNNSLLIMPD